MQIYMGMKALWGAENFDQEDNALTIPLPPRRVCSCVKVRMLSHFEYKYGKRLFHFHHSVLSEFYDFLLNSLRFS